MANYGGFQQGMPRLELDENGQQQVVYDNEEISPYNQHQSVGSAFGKTTSQLFDPRKSMLPYLLPYANWAGGTGLAGSAASNATGGAAPMGANGLPSGLLPGVTPHVGPAAIGSGGGGGLAGMFGKFYNNPLGRRVVNRGIDYGMDKLIGAFSGGGGNEDSGMFGPTASVGSRRQFNPEDNPMRAMAMSRGWQPPPPR